MKTLVAALLVLSFSAVAAPLKVTPLVGTPQGFFVTSTLVTGEKEAVLIDAAFTLADAHRAAAAVLDSGKTLTTVYVTHAHPDHYFGLSVLKASFPNAKILARPDTIADINKSWKGKLDQWKPMYGANLTDAPVVPEPLTGDVITLEGEKLQVVGGVQGDDPHNSFVWIPSVKTVIGGDTLYNGVHVWTAETRAPARKAWLATLDKVEKLKPEVVISGHQTPDAKSDVSAIAFTRDYLKAFDAALTGSKTSAEVLEKVKAKYPNAALDIIAKIGSDAQFAK